MKPLFLHPNDIRRIPDPSIQLVLVRSGIEFCLREPGEEFGTDAPSVFRQLESAGWVRPGEGRLLGLRDAVAHGNAEGVSADRVQASTDLHFRIYDEIVAELERQPGSKTSFSSLDWPSFKFQERSWIRGATTYLKSTRERLDGSIWTKIRATRRPKEFRELFRNGMAEFRAQLDPDLIRRHSKKRSADGTTRPDLSLPPGCLPIEVIRSIPDKRVALICSIILFEFLLRKTKPAWFEKAGVGVPTKKILTLHKKDFTLGSLLLDAYDVRNKLLHSWEDVHEYEVGACGETLNCDCVALANEVGGELGQYVIGAASHPLWSDLDEAEMIRVTRNALSAVKSLSEWKRGRSRIDPRSWPVCFLDMIAGDDANLQTFTRSVAPALDVVLADEDLIGIIATGKSSGDSI